jgi:branched-chain amino acid transport system ATP-binding protein
VTLLLAVAGLAKAFDGFKAVDGVSFSVAAGQVVALIGPNGAGKTTTFNMINGQLTPDRGKVLLDGRDITGLPPRRLWHLGVGRTFQITATFTTMTVAENVGVVLLSRDRNLGLLKSATRQNANEIEALLGEVGMQAAASRPCGTLSYGDLKRVELAMALAHRPRLLLMDEPTAGMAPSERGQLMALVASLARERNTAVLFTEHDMDVVFRHAAHIFVMNRGRIVAEGSPDDVRHDSTVREVYLGRVVPQIG